METSRKIFDLPTRVFHTVFVVGFLTAFIIAKNVDDEAPTFVIHMLAGFTLSFAVFLRALWGIFGSKTARFSSFNLNPAELLRYFKGLFGKPSDLEVEVRNPAASYSALAMMGLAVSLGTTGYLMSVGYKEQLEDLHEILANSFFVIAAVHVMGVVVHSIKHRDQMFLSMVLGTQRASGVVQSKAVEPISHFYIVQGAAMILLFVGFGAAIWKGYDPTSRRLSLFGTSLQLGEDSNSGDEKARDSGSEDSDEK